MLINNTDTLKCVLTESINRTKILDIHTHLFSPEFGELLLWGIDELLTYHYLVAELFRYTDIPYSQFWAMTKKEQAELVWKTLFIENSPCSEACRGVLTVLQKLGLDPAERDLEKYRQIFNGLNVSHYVSIVFEKANISGVVMTNDPFDEVERGVWESNYKEDSRFLAALRIDPLVNSWEVVSAKLVTMGYRVCPELNVETLGEIRRFIREWVEKTDSLYIAASLPPSFDIIKDHTRAKIIEECILPVARERSLPFAMMIGTKGQVNPELGTAGYSAGKGSLDSVEYLCHKYTSNKFMLTMLVRENQHEVCITARKFRNLMVFGCWWFLNNPTFIAEMTQMRLEMLGLSFIPQHSDCRVLDQLIYKWEHSKRIIAEVLYQKYADILSAGWTLEETEVHRDVEKLFNGNFRDFIGKRLP